MDGENGSLGSTFDPFAGLGGAPLDTNAVHNQNSLCVAEH